MTSAKWQGFTKACCFYLFISFLIDLLVEKIQGIVLHRCHRSHSWFSYSILNICHRASEIQLKCLKKPCISALCMYACVSLSVCVYVCAQRCISYTHILLLLFYSGQVSSPRTAPAHTHTCTTWKKNKSKLHHMDYIVWMWIGTESKINVRAELRRLIKLDATLQWNT